MRSATTNSKCRRRPTGCGTLFMATRRSVSNRLRPARYENTTRIEQGKPVMYQTTSHRPASVEEAAALFAKGSESKYLAGGHTLIPVMKQRLASPSDVIDLGKIGDLIGIEASADTLTIKAATTHHDVATSGAAQKAIPALAHLASMIGDPAVRYRGTIGGSIANNDPAADYPAALLALGASIKTNKREIAAAKFFAGLFETALKDGEIVTAVSFTAPAKAAYEKFRNPA